MQIIKKLRKLMVAHKDGKELTPEQKTEAQRIMRRLRKFPRLIGCPNPHAHRMAHFRHRFGIQ